MRKFNSIQTELTDKILDGMPREEKADLLDSIDSIQFIQNLADPNRKYAKDLDRWDNPLLPLVSDDPALHIRKLDPKGRIAVNLTNPHILEDMDYFRPAAIHFEKHNCYTKLFPNKNPNSMYYKFWAEEARRCREGYDRESDGEWIPGNYYFQLNYAPLLRSEIIEGTKQSDRLEAFAYVWDADYWFFHYVEQARALGMHGANLKRRGCGYSVKASVMLGKNFILGDTTRATKKVKSFAIANEKEYLIKDGVLNKFVAVIDWNATHTPWPRVRSLKDSLNDMHWRMGRKDNVKGTEVGVLNEVMGVTLKNDAQKARGKRGALVLWEEAGKFQDFLTAWKIAQPSVETSAGYAFGFMMAGGTGGVEGGAFEGLEEIFYNSAGYNIMSMPNVFDKNTNGKGECAFFFGTYLNYDGNTDKNGNSDVIGALIGINRKRSKIKYGSSDVNTIVQTKAEEPITPQEAIMRTEGTAFPVADLRDYLEDIAPELNSFVDSHYVGKIGYDDSGFTKWINSNDIVPIRDYPFKVKGGVQSDGAIEIFEMPNKDRDGKVFENRYIGGIDPIDNDYTIGGSLASIIIFDLWTDKIVAEYTGRPVMADEFYETCLRLTAFYNAQSNYENNLKGLFSYFSNHNALYLLADSPDILRDMEIVKTALYGNRSKGTRTTKEVIKLGKTLQRQWMLSPYEEERYDETSGETITMTIPNLRRIRSIGYIKECIAWNPDINTDRVSAMDMVMILREDRAKMTTKFEENRNENVNTFFHDDEFLDANWQAAVAKMGGDSNDGFGMI
ncbi:MAG: hypothetical protein KUG81_07525 [Gammaproteobacteria bacterium]|nr:hypothetical protein [Gammaproteobacteria bacterium]